MNDDPIRILMVEDNDLDAGLIIERLGKDGIRVEARRVDDESAFVDAVDRFAPDIVISDLALPAFSGLRALDLARERMPEVPFIFVSRAMGEEAAVDAVRRGATDYVSKNNLARLSASVRRALREAAERRARKRAEQDLLRAQRYEALALLASGLSHDLRNVLQPIAISASTLIEEGDEKTRKIGLLLQTCTQRGLDIVSAMLGFARGARTTDVVKVTRLLEGLRTLLRGSVSKNTELVIQPPVSEIEIDGNYTELQQCLLNLCLNALQAMPDGGRLTLAAYAHDLDGGFFEENETARPGSYLRIEVCDNGIGMSDEVKANLFKAFFTTKKEGTGLGLLSCRRIIEDHLGYLRIASKPGEGTTFSLYIPLRTATDAAAADAQAPLGRGQRILLVSEGASVLSTMGNILSDHGYSVLPVQSGPAALREIENGLPDLVLMEAQMNLTTGVRTLSALIERDYRGPVIMIVEPGQGASMADDLPPIPNLRLIEKPVNAATLLRVAAQAATRTRS